MTETSGPLTIPPIYNLKEWHWSETLKAWVNRDTGQEIPLSVIETIIDSANGTVSDKLKEYARSFLIDATNLNARDTFVNHVMEELRSHFLRMFLLGRGGREHVESPQEYNVLGDLISAQSEYLYKFALDIHNGTLSEPQILARAQAYAHAGRQAYAYALTQVQTNGAVARDFMLPAFPGDGSTVCLTNCRCNWHIVTRSTDSIITGYDCYWELGHADHCDDCLARSTEWAPLVIYA